jgi:hypothetical protein
MSSGFENGYLSIRRVPQNEPFGFYPLSSYVACSIHHVSAACTATPTSFLLDLPWPKLSLTASTHHTRRYPRPGVYCLPTCRLRLLSSGNLILKCSYPPPRKLYSTSGRPQESGSKHDSTRVHQTNQLDPGHKQRRRRRGLRDDGNGSESEMDDFE